MWSKVLSILQPNFSDSAMTSPCKSYRCFPHKVPELLPVDIKFSIGNLWTHYTLVTKQVFNCRARKKSKYPCIVKVNANYKPLFPFSVIIENTDFTISLLQSDSLEEISVTNNLWTFLIIGSFQLKIQIPVLSFFLLAKSEQRI